TDHQIVDSDNDNDEELHKGTLQLYIEGINAIIKKEVLHNTTLLHLVDAIQNRLNEEARYAQIMNKKNTNPTIGLPHIADSLIQKYLTSHILSLQRQQLSESFLYETIEVSFDWDKDFPEPENIMEDGYIEDDYNLNDNRDLISLHPPIRLCEANQPLISDNYIHVINFRYLAQLRTRNVLTPTLKKSISEKSRWSKGYGISKKALNLMIHLNCDNEFLQIMEVFIFLKTHELELLKNEKENNENIIESQQSVVANPYIAKCCSRPPKSFKNALENTTNMCQNSQNTKSTVDHIEQCEKKEKMY
ncbi:19672_t:CDS:2, partial [Gigaspora margarita]